MTPPAAWALTPQGTLLDEHGAPIAQLLGGHSTRSDLALILQATPLLMEYMANNLEAINHARTCRACDAVARVYCLTFLDLSARQRAIAQAIDAHFPDHAPPQAVDAHFPEHAPVLVIEHRWPGA